VAITVESMFSMKRATATISGTIRLESMRRFDGSSGESGLVRPT
jgi:hypothetical protein